MDGRRLPAFTNDWSAIYRFDADAADDQGQYYGLLQNGAAIQDDPVHGHVLNLNGTNQYVSLPPGVGYAQTFAAVVKWRGGGAWQRIFDFGFDTSKTVMLTPASGDNVLRCDIIRVAIFKRFNGTSGSLPMYGLMWRLCWMGRKGALCEWISCGDEQFHEPFAGKRRSADESPWAQQIQRRPFLQRPICEFPRLWTRSYRQRNCSSAASNFPAPVGTSWVPGQTINFSGDATDFADVPLSATNLNWQIMYVLDGVTNLVYGPIHGTNQGSYTIPSNDSGSGSFFVTLTATDSSNRQSSASVSLFPSSQASSWSSYYPFDSGARMPAIATMASSWAEPAFSPMRSRGTSSISPEQTNMSVSRLDRRGSNLQRLGKMAWGKCLAAHF